ncbi:hypothetical protein L1I30_05585 [Gillisia sp. M10.2A]|uniref:Uncharacterized protein n=1 Tax=Gillisia lutea TaxID=2909668 RepID=A0ABS9EEB8_9FLAO|nr:hypothetical protein [Gillisia lutea]MCF4101128.1 hypothetical protein [Gillisia lutea]
MNVYRTRPKGQFIQEANWSELYTLTSHWKSDLEFYQDDARFLHHLIDKYFIWITKDENLKMVQNLKMNLEKVEKTCKDLLTKVAVHHLKLGKLIERTDENARLFRIEHEHLEDEIADFVKAFRANRKKVFNITTYIVDSEKLIQLLET